MVNQNVACPVLSAKASSHDTMVSAVYWVLAERLRLLQLKPLSIVTFINEVQPINTFFPIEMILLGRMVVDSEVQSRNALSPIEVILLGRTIVVNETQELNA